jgi:MFS family permease
MARILYPKPEELGAPIVHGDHAAFSRMFWVYLIGAALVAAGFADYSLIAFHFGRADHVPLTMVAVFYSVAMAVSGSASLLFGWLLDRHGMAVLIPLTIVSAAFAPLVFFGQFWLALVGAAIWGLGMGVHESMIPAAVGYMVPANCRASAYGIFTGVYGIAWFLGSLVIGALYMKSLAGVVAFCVVTQLAAIPIFAWITRRLRDDRNRLATAP